MARIRKERQKTSQRINIGDRKIDVNFDHANTVKKRDDGVVQVTRWKFSTLLKKQIAEMEESIEACGSDEEKQSLRYELSRKVDEQIAKQEKFFYPKKETALLKAMKAKGIYKS